MYFLKKRLPTSEINLMIVYNVLAVNQKRKDDTSKKITGEKKKKEKKNGSSMSNQVATTDRVYNIRTTESKPQKKKQKLRILIKKNKQKRKRFTSCFIVW